MIDKLIKVFRVGRFSDYAASGDMTLRKVSLIFGENGRGKSTLGAIFRSLQTGEPDHITQRATLNRTGNPEVRVLLEKGKLVKFADGKWDCDPALIEIFDADFVFNNVYVGNDVSHDHKKATYKVIVGEKGVALSRRVEELDALIREANRNVTEARGLVEKQIDGAMTADAFVSLAPASDIIEQIAIQEKAIAAQKSSSEVKKKGLLTKLNLPTLPDLAILGSTLADVSDTAEKAFAEHVERSLGDGAEEWVSQGYQYLANKTTCPFCGEGIHGNSVIAAYKAHFNDEYAALKEMIQQVAADVKSAFGSTQLLAVQVGAAGNEVLLEFWKRFSSISLPELQFATIESAWNGLKLRVDELIKKKAGAPLEAVAHSAELSAAAAAFDAVRDRLTAYNAAIDVANVAIQTKKSETAAGNAAAEEAILSLLKNTKSRHRPEVLTLCLNYVKRQAEKAALDVEKSTAKDMLDLHANAIFPLYQTELNKLLAAFGADFQITSTFRSFVGGKPSSSYAITVNSVEVPLDKFGSTLSIGDRSALALAFFLVKLAHDPDISKKCCVFDDPVCSLDRFRMDCTVQQILKVISKAKQVIVLCHDPRCLKRIADHLPQGDLRTFFIDRYGNDSVLSEWDIEKETRSQYFHDYFALADYVQLGPAGRNLRDLARKIRPVLEENLRMRFPEEFSTGWLGDFIKRIRAAAVGTPLATLKLVVDELSEINDYSKQYHHSSNPELADSVPVSEPELKAFANRTFGFVRGTT
jgi:wobble nucleotide-excising tRNase